MKSGYQFDLSISWLRCLYWVPSLACQKVSIFTLVLVDQACGVHKHRYARSRVEVVHDVLVGVQRPCAHSCTQNQSELCVRVAMVTSLILGPARRSSSKH